MENNIGEILQKIINYDFLPVFVGSFLIFLAIVAWLWNSIPVSKKQAEKTNNTGEQNLENGGKDSKKKVSNKTRRNILLFSVTIATVFPYLYYFFTPFNNVELQTNNMFLGSILSMAINSLFILRFLDSTFTIKKNDLYLFLSCILSGSVLLYFLDLHFTILLGVGISSGLISILLTVLLYKYFLKQSKKHIKPK